MSTVSVQQLKVGVPIWLGRRCRAIKAKSAGAGKDLREQRLFAQRPTWCRQALRVAPDCGE